MIDRFGKNLMMIPVDEDYFTVNVDVHVSGHFFGWIISLGDGVKIIGPEDIVEQIMAGKKVSKGKGGVGLQNVQERLQLVFGDGFGMMIHSEPDEGTEVNIRIPVVLWEELAERGLDSV